MKMENNLAASSSPHLKSGVSTRRIMLDVIIALLPPLIAAIYFFRLPAALLIAVTTVSCVVFEYLWGRITKKAATISDLSAVVTGILLAFNLSPRVPLWAAVIGGFFAIIVVKQLFGGLGHNFVNPALAARAFLMASWPVPMTAWVNPGTDIVSSATPLVLLKKGSEAVGQMPALADLLTGNVAGCIGETSTLALLLGGIYLLVRRVITPEIPVAFIGTVGLLSWIWGGDALFTGNFLYYIPAGGLMLGAFFMATDYTTSPVTSRGKIVMGIGCGLLTALIRQYGGYPEGVSYSILLMNLVVPLIDRYITPQRFGGIWKNA
jgi:electron transport complex protein RnfD